MEDLIRILMSRSRSDASRLLCRPHNDPGNQFGFEIFLWHLSRIQYVFGLFGTALHCVNQ